jgi:Beta-propeller repeat
MKLIDCIVLFSAFASAPFTPAAAQDLLWARQAGTTASEKGTDVAADSAGNVSIAGFTRGSLGGPNAGSADAFVTRYDSAGRLLWTRQIGTSRHDQADGVAADSAGNTYVTGVTDGSLGGTSAGDGDVFLAKYDASGRLLWTRQIGTAAFEWGNDVEVDGAGNAYIVGHTRGGLGGPSAGGFDVFLVKYDAAGRLLWTRQIGTGAWDVGEGVAVDNAGNAYITGSTEGSLGGPNAGDKDVFLAKYDASGALLWTRQTGTAAVDVGFGVALDSAGNAYVAGYTFGSLGGPNAGAGDVLLAKYDASGTNLWIHQTGSAAIDQATGVAVDSAGNAYISGRTMGSLGGPIAGFADALVAKYDASGTMLWTRQFGTRSIDEGFAVAVDSAGNAYITGRTSGSLGGPSAGDADYFLAKYGEAICYADCDQSTGVGVLDMFDFLCFQKAFVNSEPYACDCDTSTGSGVCDVFDYLCFQDAFVAGCP